MSEYVLVCEYDRQLKRAVVRVKKVDYNGGHIPPTLSL